MTVRVDLSDPWYRLSACGRFRAIPPDARLALDLVGFAGEQPGTHELYVRLLADDKPVAALPRDVFLDVFHEARPIVADPTISVPDANLSRGERAGDVNATAPIHDSNPTPYRR